MKEYDIKLVLREGFFSEDPWKVAVYTEIEDKDSTSAGGTYIGVDVLYGTGADVNEAIRDLEDSIRNYKLEK